MGLQVFVWIVEQRHFHCPTEHCWEVHFIQTVGELYEMVGQELRLNKIDSLLGPGMNIHRNPLNGRNFEYISEDPILTGRICAAQVKAMGKWGNREVQ